MSRIGKWNPNKLYQETAQWLQRPSTKELFIEDPLHDFEEFILSKPFEFSYGSVTVGLHSRARWYAAKFLAEIFEGKPSALENLHRSFQYDLSETFILSAYGKSGIPKHIPWISFNDHGLYLAKGLAIGCLQDAKHLVMVMTDNFKNNMYVGLRQTKLSPFILKLAYSWQNLTVDFEEQIAPLPDFYEQIIADWQDSNSDKLEQALLKACDFHLERSREHTNKDTFEFVDEIYRVFPAEILGVLRLRETMGLPVIELDHQLMKTPAAKLYPVIEPPRDELLEKIKEKARAELHIQY